MKFKLFIVLASFGLGTANADTAYVAYGVGAFNSAKGSIGAVKIGQVGYIKDVYRGLYWQGKLGYWGDGSGDPTRKNSAYLTTGGGMLIDLRPIEIRSGWGLTVISTPDSFLGASFPQFNGEAYIGLRDKRGNGIGAKYEHISCASLCTPNHGRDFWLLELSQSW